jgi:hypothetical protein
MEEQWFWHTKDLFSGTDTRDEVNGGGCMHGLSRTCMIGKPKTHSSLWHVFISYYGLEIKLLNAM